MYTENSVQKSIEWDDSHTIPHYVLTVGSVSESCEFEDYRATVNELLALANRS